MAKPKVPNSSAVPPVGLLTHSPGPGLYSRLERAIEQLPPTVKMDGLQGKLQKYKEGVAGYELSPLMENLAISDVMRQETTGSPRKDISRKELLDIVHKTSPVFTHRQGVLSSGASQTPDAPGRLGEFPVIGTPQWSSITEEGLNNYREHLLMQPNASHVVQSPRGSQWDGGHWDGYPDAIAHMRTGDAGDAVRLMELQSDVRNQNVKHKSQGGATEKWPSHRVPLYKDYPDVLMKSLLLDAARTGKRAIEISPFEAINDMTRMGMPAVQQIYGGTAPSALIRAARPLGGLIDATPFERSESPAITRSRDAINRAMNDKYAEFQDTFYRAIGDLYVPEVYGTGAPWAWRTATGEDVHWVANGMYTDQYPPTAMNVEVVADSLVRDLAEHRLAEALNNRFVDNGLRPIGVENLDNFFDLDADSTEYMNWRNIVPLDEATKIRKAITDQTRSDVARRLPDMSREMALGRELISGIRELRRQGQALPYSHDVDAPSRRFEISDDLRRNIIRNGIGLSVLGQMLLDRDQGQAAE